MWKGWKGRTERWRCTWYNSISGDCTHRYRSQHRLRRRERQIHYLSRYASSHQLKHCSHRLKYSHSSSIWRRYRGPAAPRRSPPPRSTAGTRWRRRCSGGKAGKRPWTSPSVVTGDKQQREEQQSSLDSLYFDFILQVNRELSLYTPQMFTDATRHVPDVFI